MPSSPPKVQPSREKERKKREATETLSLSLLRPLSRLLSHLFPPRNRSLGANAAKHEADAQPLHVREAVSEGDDGEDHGEHFAGDCYCDEEDGGEGGEGVDWLSWLVCLSIARRREREKRAG